MHEEPTVPLTPTDKLQPDNASGKLRDTARPAVVSSPGAHRGMSRRQMLGLGLAGGAAVAAAGVGIEQLIQHGGLPSLFHGPVAGSMQIGHLLRRAGFGASPQDLQTYGSLSFQDAVDRLLNYQNVSDDDMENRLKSLNLDLNQPQNQQRWWLLRMAWTQRPLLEKMTLFWHGHFTSSFRKVGGPKVYIRMIMQNQFLRQHAFDTFDDLLLGITADPAMLFYLDLTKSHKTAPNENYARELMELFTIGLGHYTQQDVSEGAAALTGWHIENGTNNSRYVPADHNNLTKVYLGHTGNLDYHDVVSILANHPATPWFIGRKLFTFFVHENPSDSDLQPLVDTYVKSNHNMGAVMRTLLLSPQFSSSTAYRSRIKSPAEFVAGTYRMLNIQDDGAGLPAMTTLMGQPLFDPPNVAGWPADKVSAFWLNSGTWMTRLNFIDSVLVGSWSKGSKAQPYNIQQVVNDNHIDSPERFVDYYASFLLDGQLPQDRRSLLIDYFNTNTNSQPAITLANGKSYALGSVRGTLYLMLASPEYQLN